MTSFIVAAICVQEDSQEPKAEIWTEGWRLWVLRFWGIKGRMVNRPWANCKKECALRPSVTCAPTQAYLDSTTFPHRDTLFSVFTASVCSYVLFIWIHQWGWQRKKKKNEWILLLGHSLPPGAAVMQKYLFMVSIHFFLMWPFSKPTDHTTTNMAESEASIWKCCEQETEGNSAVIGKET